MLRRVSLVLLYVHLAANVRAEQEPAPAPFDEGLPPDENRGNFVARGLFDLEDPFPLAVLHLQLPVDTLEVLKEGERRLDLNFNWANSFALERTFLVDAETYRLKLTGWYALDRDVYVGATMPVLARDSGILDPLVEGFHDAFNLGEGKRNKRPRNAYEISISRPGKKKLTLDRGIGAGDLTLRAHWNVHHGTAILPAVAIDGLASLPTSTAGFGSTGVDVGIALSFYKDLWNVVHLFAVLGGTYLTDSKTEGIRYEKEGYEVVAGLEIKLTRRLSFIAQNMNFSPLLREPKPLSQKRNYVAGGIKWEFMDQLELDLSLVENLFPFTNSADIAFAAGLSFRF